MKLLKRTFLYILCLVSLTSSFGFIHPKQLEAQRIRESELLRLNQSPQPSSYSVFNILAGNMSNSQYAKQSSCYTIEYGLISKDNLSIKGSLTVANNQDSLGNNLKAIPAELNVLWGYPFSGRMGGYLGTGLNYTLLQDSVSKQGLGFQVLAGWLMVLSDESALLVEYDKQFLSIDGVNYDHDLLKFGISFKFLPEPIQPTRRPLR